MSQFQSTTEHSSPDQPAFRVREATPEDNAALLTLDRQCVVAAATPVAFDRSPDFFARSRPYAHWRTYVAEGESGLIGVGAMALKQVLVDGRPVEAAYFYDLRVAPGYRRLGVAKAVGDAIRAYTRSLGPAIGYSLVMEGNVASLTFVQGRGSRPLRSCALSLIPVEGIGATDPTRLRALGDARDGVCAPSGAGSASGSRPVPLPGCGVGPRPAPSAGRVRVRWSVRMGRQGHPRRLLRIVGLFTDHADAHPPGGRRVGLGGRARPSPRLLDASRIPGCARVWQTR